MSLKERIEKVKSASYHDDPTPENWKEFKRLWNDMTGYFLKETNERDPKISIEDREKIPTIDFLGTSKAEELYSLMNHDVNASFWYHERFDFNEFWEGTLVKIIELFERWDEGKDNENPDTLEHLVWRGDQLKKKSYSIYNVTGTTIWRRAIYVKSEEERQKRIEKVTKRLRALEEEEKRYIEKWGKTHYYDDHRKMLNNHLDLLNRRIGNDKSMLLILKIEGA